RRDGSSTSKRWARSCSARPSRTSSDASRRSLPGLRRAGPDVCSTSGYPPRGEDAMAGMLEGKAALITGGGGGIGRATALLFAREGARVAVADLSEAAAKETADMIAAAGGQAVSFGGGDVSKADDVRRMVDGAVSAFGRLDCAFNNAGIAALH